MKHIKKAFLGDYRSFLDEKSYKIFFITNLFLILGIPLHGFYAGLFMYIGIKSMVLIEIASITALTIAIYINHKRIKYIPSFIMCMEIGINGVLWALTLKSGFSHYLYTFIALLGVFLFLELKKAQKIFITIFLFVCVNIAHSAENRYLSFVMYKDIEWLSSISLNIVFILITAELLINEISNNTIKALYTETVKKMENEIMQDPLTKLYNRRYFQDNEEVFNEDSKKSDYCAVVLDIDHFKKINDTYGHNTGDKVLIFFAHKMTSEFRASDVVIRWGGEEFVILLSNTSLTNAVKKLKSFSKIIQKSVISLEDKTINFTFTAGICKVKSDMTVSDAISQADKYLYDGKMQGRNRIVYK